jgi:hypothetical protein
MAVLKTVFRGQVAQAAPWKMNWLAAQASPQTPLPKDE